MKTGHKRVEDYNMKNNIVFLFGLAILFAGCSFNQEIELPDPSLTISARTETQADTKTVVEDETKVYWEPGDEIKVFSGNNSGKFTTDITESSGTATFNGTLGVDALEGGLDLWAVYPYFDGAVFDGQSITTVLPSEQVARAGSFGKDMNLSIAHSTTTTLQFYNVGGGIRFNVTQEGVKRVVFEGQNNEILAGKVKIGFGENGKPVVQEVTEGSPLITILPPSGQSTFQKNTWYYIVAIPGPLDSGYKLRFYMDATYAKKVSDKAVTIKRSIFGNIRNADAGLEYESMSSPFPKTEEEWRESDEITMGISSSVNQIVNGYNLEEEQSVEQIVQDISGLENVASVTSNEDGSQLIIKQVNGVFVNLIIDRQDDNDGEDSQAPAASQASSASPELVTKSAQMMPDEIPHVAAVAGANVKSNKAILLSPYQDKYPSIGPVIDADYLDATLDAMGYNLVNVPPERIKLRHFTGDNLSQYALVLIASHGADRFTTMDGTITTTVVNTGIEVGTLDDGLDRSLLAAAICNGKTNYYVTVPWLEATTSEPDAFAGSLVYFGSCRSYKDDDFAGFFESHHAGFLGHDSIMAVQFDNMVMHSLVNSLSKGMSFTSAVESISRDPWVKSEQKRLAGGTLWFFDFTASTVPWKVSPSKLKKVDSPLHLIDSAPVNLRHNVKGNRARMIWDLPFSDGEFQYKVHLNGQVFESDTPKGFTSGPLKPGSYTWYVVAELLFEGEVVDSFRSTEDHFSVGEGTSSMSADAVDLGLSVKWASANVGAASSSDIGDYFAWGETVPGKDVFTWENYDFGPSSSLTMYNATDALTILRPEHDAVHCAYGGNWRMPTVDEWSDLRNKCDWVEVKDGDVLLGYNVFSRTNDNYIFLPTGGYMDGAELKNANSARYWYGSITNGGRKYWARNLNESSYYEGSGVYSYGDNRYLGMPVRGVYDDSYAKITPGEIVDLGLSVKWAGYNVGAGACEESGNFYAWGETEPDDKYTWNSYSFGNSDALTDYNSQDALTYLEREHDVAYQRLGAPYWRMPTIEEWAELKRDCEWISCTVNGQRGYRIKSKINDNSIFLPVYGYLDDTQIHDGMRPRYWSSSITNGGRKYWARNLNESSYYEGSGVYSYGDNRCLGMPVRAVYDETRDKVRLTEGEFIDMGVSVDWARCNMGTSLPEETGSYYAWGDVTPKRYFSWDNYCWGPSNNLRKYNGNDALVILDREDDVVYRKYKTNHRIPTKTEWDELWNNCNKEIIVLNGRRGYLLTSKTTHNTLFIPLSGYKDGVQLRDGMRPRYWSSSLTNGGRKYWARNLNESSYYEGSGVYSYGDNRYLGMPVRGVRAKYESKVTDGSVIDLGLSVKWASCNFGASVPEAHGDYYAWGETDVKEYYSSGNYSLMNSGDGALKKYSATDSRMYLDWEDDVIHKKKGGYWRMPTIDEWAELRNNCVWTETTLNGIRGYRIESKVNDNSIFLPIAGYMDGTQLRDGMRPRYWANILTNGGRKQWARNLNESSYYEGSGIYSYGDNRFFGMPVRGVYDNSVEKVLSEGETIDMGLSVEWASCNIGSDGPESFGWYFGWGEVQTHSEYSWSNYTFSADGSATMSKYNSTDKITILESSDDVAYHYTGGRLRMPTIEEWSQLMNNTTSELKFMKGHVGYLLTSKINGNCIFLPIAGYKDGMILKDGMKTRYWSSSLTNGGRKQWARNLKESSYYEGSGIYSYGDNRYLGMPVRGVTDEHNTQAISVKGVFLDRSNLKLGIHGSAQLSATVRPSNATNKGLTWSSSDESVVTVSSSGFVNAVSYGVATIKVTTSEGGFTASCSVSVESTDYSADGKVHKIQSATEGNGIDIVIMGDAFSDRQIADGTYMSWMNRTAEAFFSEEPFTTYRNLFNVYVVDVVSRFEGYGYADGQALGGHFGTGTYCGGDNSKCESLARKAVGDDRMDNTVIIVAMNSTSYSGTCHWDTPLDTSGDFGAGTSIAYFAIGTTGESLEKLVRHEAGGHGFGKLEDEYTTDGHEAIPQSRINSIHNGERYGWNKNVDFTDDRETVKWARFLADDRYKNEGLGIYEGGATYRTGVWRPSAFSIMYYNIGGFNAPSREAIWYRIHKLAYGRDWTYDYEEFVEYDAINRSISPTSAPKLRPNMAERDSVPTHPPVYTGKTWREVLGEE